MNRHNATFFQWGSRPNKPETRRLAWIAWAVAFTVVVALMWAEIALGATF